MRRRWGAASWAQCRLEGRAIGAAGRAFQRGDDDEMVRLEMVCVYVYDCV